MHHRCKGFVIVYAMMLGITFSYPLGLIVFNHPVYMALDLVEPSSSNCNVTLGQGHQHGGVVSY